MTNHPPIQDIRPSPIAGRWYPGDAQRLTRSIDQYILNASVPVISGRVVGILAPHAGHQYSGPVAGYAFKAIQDMVFDTVVIVGPSHYPYSSALLTTGHDAYETPLGVVPVARDMLDDLNELMPITTVRDDPEHCLEIELPFLQRILGNFTLIPLAMVDQSWTIAERLGHALARVLEGCDALLVASSDLSHFYPQVAANRLDQRVLDAVNAFDAATVIGAEADQRKIACGHGAIAAVMIAAQQRGADAARVLHYATSGDVSHDYERVVGYAAAVFYARA